MYKDITLTNYEQFTNIDLCVMKSILDKSNFKQLIKKFHPDVNKGKATEAFQRLMSLKTYEADTSECKHLNKSNIVEITVDQLLNYNVYGAVYIVYICPKCNGLGYTSKSHIVSKCDKCDNGVIYRKAKTILLLEKGNLTSNTTASVRKDMLILTNQDNSFSANIIDAMPINVANKIALMMIGKNPSCTVEINGETLSADCGNIVHINSIRSNIFKLYALIS